MGHLVQNAAVAPQISQSGNAPSELQILEPGKASLDPCARMSNQHNLDAAPISSTWILEGTPVARVKLLSGSTDDRAFTFMWDCTAGRFNWFYGIDETICLLEGSVVIKDHNGATHCLSAGDTFYFPKGTCAEWTVNAYVRKIAFIHVPLPGKLLQVRRILKAIKRFVKPAAGGKPSNTLPTA